MKRASYLLPILFALSLMFSSYCGGPYVEIPDNVELGKEYPFPDEESITKQTLDLTLTNLAEAYKDGELVRRDAHPKHHGCVTGSFTIKKDLDPSLKIGVFQPGKSYTTLLRFSNGATKPMTPDKEGGIRGIAIKLFDVPGDKIIEEEKASTTQDFLLINNSILPVGAPDEYLALFKAGFAGKPLGYFFGWNPIKWKLTGFNKIRAIRAKKISSMLETRYWSTTPYAFGEAKAVKYSVKPCDAKVTEIPAEPTDNYLRETMNRQLKESPACFEFMVQVQTDPKTMPVEDPATEWNEEKSPFITVAELIIPKQEFDFKERDELCENVSYSPWHALPEHRPMGGINRVRKSVYIGISKYRHDRNKSSVKEIDKKDIPTKSLPST